MLKKKMLCVYISCVCVFSAVALGDEKYEERERIAAEHKMSRMRSLFKNMDKKIFFYGKVVDQYGDPVEGARVPVGVAHFSPKPPFFAIKDIIVKTDKSGIFEVKRVRGHELGIYAISKEGYEYEYSSNRTTSFRYAGDDGGEEIFVPKKNHPVVFFMRKKGETACLSKGRFRFSIEKGGDPCYIDLIRPDCRGKQHWLSDYRKPAHIDVIVSACLDKKHTSFIVKFAVPDAGGVIVSDKLLYVAPEDGYSSNVVVTVLFNKKAKEQHVYIKSRGGLVYGRLDVGLRAIAFSQWTHEHISMTIESFGNAFGRELEDELSLPYDLRKRLLKEAEESLEQGKRPRKPDLKALINAEKEQKRKEKMGTHN